MPSRELSLEELAEDFAEIKASLASLNSKLDHLDRRFVPRELYEARHAGLRSEINLELTSLRSYTDTQVSNASSTAESARALSLWALGILASAVVVALVGFLLAASRSVT